MIWGVWSHGIFKNIFLTCIYLTTGCCHMAAFGLTNSYLLNANFKFFLFISSITIQHKDKNMMSYYGSQCVLITLLVSSQYPSPLHSWTTLICELDQTLTNYVHCHVWTEGNTGAGDVSSPEGKDGEEDKGSSCPSLLWVQGAAGMGKSAVMAKTARVLQQVD